MAVPGEPRGCPEAVSLCVCVGPGRALEAGDAPGTEGGRKCRRCYRDGSDVTRVPAGWSEERVQEYFRWAAAVVAGLRGTSAALEGALQRLFEERGVPT